ncbi:hypothetical protein V6N13_130254 [Hibiscus sabdariffa]
MITPGKLSLFDSLSFETWLLKCFKNVAGIGIDDDIWNMRFAVTCWLIYKNCCANVFGGVGLHGEGLVRYGSLVAAEFAAVHAYRTLTRQMHQSPWCWPEWGWITVNCD